MALAKASVTSFLSSTSCLRSKPVQQRSRGSVKVCAADRTLWLPGAAAPSHLNGKLAGDSGFDPLGLGTDGERLKWYAEAEKINGRWAMMAVVGILAAEALGKPAWWNAGAEEYWLPSQPLIAIEAVIMGFLELKRFQGWKETGTSGFLNAFPFDPAGMNSSEMAVKEVKNGRLAMVAFVGFAFAALVARQGPLEALASHLSNPFANNIGGSIANLPNVIGK